MTKSWKKTSLDIIILIFFNLSLVLLVWLPHYLRIDQLLGLSFKNGFETIYRNYDGIEYIVIAKSFYFPNLVASLPQSLPTQYYAAHFPGYALFILMFAPLLGFLKSMLFVSSVFTLLSAIAFFFLLKKFSLTNHPLILSLIFLCLPARWLVVRSVGSAEPMFIFFTILCIYFFMQFVTNNRLSTLFASSIAGSLAQLTRPPGILIFLALAIFSYWQIFTNTKKIGFRIALLQYLRLYPLLLIPLTLGLVFYWYHISLGDFFAYFHSGDNIHLTFPPFQVFNKNQFWVGEIWLEDIIYILLIGFSGAMLLIKQKLHLLGVFALVYLTATSLVAHRDISRYSLPVFPFVLIAFEKYLTSKEFRIVLIILALAIYLYAQNFLLSNTAPISNVEVFN